MADSTAIELTQVELREVARYVVACARPALLIFERHRPDDRRPRRAPDAAQAFADRARRTTALRDRARAAQRAAQEAHAAGAAFLHPLAKATQVKHVLGSAAHAARALELATPDDPVVGTEHLAQARTLAPAVVVDVLRRYPAAPPGAEGSGS